MNILILRIKKVALTKDAKFEQAGTKKGTKKFNLKMMIVRISRWSAHI